MEMEDNFVVAQILEESPKYFLLMNSIEFTWMFHYALQ